MEAEREAMKENGLLRDNVRKLLSKDDSASSNAEDNRLAANKKMMKIPLNKVLRGNGPFPSYHIEDFTYVLRLGQVEEVMSGSQLDGYTIENMWLELEAIKPKMRADENGKVSVINNTVGDTAQAYRNKQIDFTQTVFQDMYEWDNASTNQITSLNLAASKLNAIIVLFKEDTANADDSETYVNPNMEEINVSLLNKPGTIFEGGGLREGNIYNEAKRWFTDQCSLCDREMNEDKFLENAYALVISFKTIPQADVINSGEELLRGSQVSLKIRKRATSKNLKAYVFINRDASIQLSNGRLGTLTE